MSMLKGIIKHFSYSSHATTKLRNEGTSAGEERIKALQKVGKTRFGTYWTSANALDPCLPHIRSLVVNKEIKFKVCICSRHPEALR